MPRFLGFFCLFAFFCAYEINYTYSGGKTEKELSPSIFELAACIRILLYRFSAGPGDLDQVIIALVLSLLIGKTNDVYTCHM